MNDSNNSIMSPLTRLVLWLAELGFFLVPLHAIDAAGRCTCGDYECRSKGKHPRTPNGSKDATNHPALLLHLFGEHFPNANVGIATGASAGIFVVDIDPRHGGDRALGELEAHHGELPVTVTSATGGGGVHFLFRHPGVKVKNSAGIIGSGIDIRGEGGLIVAPPSVHASGKPYTWIRGRSPGDIAVADAPAWLLNLVRGNRRGRAERRAQRDLVRHIARAGAAEGGRNDSVVRLAGHLLRHHVDPYVALDLVLSWNSTRNVPPLDDGEVKAAVDSIAARELARREGRHGR